MDCLRVALLGPLQVTLNGRPITGFAYDKVRALLAYLIVNAQQRHSREKLAEMLWPESDPETARTSLRKALSTLRRALDDTNLFQHFLLIDSDNIQFNPASEYWLDLNELKAQLELTTSHVHHGLRPCEMCIQNLMHVEELFAGDFLQELVVDSVEFEEWMLTLREHVRTRVLSALHELTCLLLNQGKYIQAQKYALREVELEPYREEAHRALMQALAKSGQRSAALAQYGTCRRILNDELGLEPGSETRSLYNQIRASRDVRPHNLPLPLPSLVGREAELQKIAESLSNPHCRLLTLTGPGGVGKTCLALQAAQENLGTFLHGAYIIHLASLDTADQILTAAINVLPFTPSGQDDPKIQLLNYLRGKSLLLVFDNFEHLLSGGNTVSLLKEISQAAPDIKVMVTSRERLKLRTEWVLTVEGLPYPSELASIHLEMLPGYAAIQLFEQRARQLVNSISLSDESYRQIAHICQMLEGTPLGIELAAGWMDQYTCRTIADEIKANLDFLVASWHDVPERHQSMRAVFQYSWKLLTEPERVILRRLSVFRSPFRPKAARQVCGALPHHLITFANKSLLSQNASGRYSIHPLIRQFLVEALQSTPQEAQEVNCAHATYYAQFMQDRENPLVIQHQLPLLDEVKLEIADVTSAWEWGIAQRNFDILSCQLESLHIYYWAQNQFHDGCSAFEQATEALRNYAPEKQLLLARMQSKLAEFLTWLGDIDEAQELIQDSLSVFRKHQNNEHLASLLFLKGMADYWQAKYSQAREAFSETIELARSTGSKHNLAHALTGLANTICEEAADYDRAFGLYQESLEIYEELGNAHGIAKNLINQGAILHGQGHYDRAEQLYQQSLKIYRKVNYSYGISAVLNNLTGINRKLGNFETASEMAAESLALKRETGNWIGILHSLLETGTLSTEMGEYEEAHSDFREALQLTIDMRTSTVRPDIILGFAELFEKMGQTKRAAELTALILTQDEVGQETREKAESLYAELGKNLAPKVKEQYRSEALKVDIDKIVIELLCDK